MNIQPRFRVTLLSVLAFTALHFAVTVVDIWWNLEEIADGIFADRPPSARRLLFDFISHPLTCLSLRSVNTPISLTLVAFLADSFLWGFGIAWAIGWVRRSVFQSGGWRGQSSEGRGPGR